MDSKQRKIRSLRGFFLYALEILENGKDYEILETNLQPFFWRKVKNIIRQNKKGALLEFLFGPSIGPESAYKGSNSTLEEKIENLQQQVDSLQEKVMNLELKNKNLKYDLSGTRIDENTLSDTQMGPIIQKAGILKTPSDISRNELIEIIKRGFELQKDKKISLKKYYEGTEKYSLFQLRGYKIKYESIRRTKLYQSLKE